ncbi:cold-shock protein [Rickettsiales endosymbiont of Stachyamoeba lipophora]|uniref:cold-shock protein n=1 Tax=Rickettsiales endosymbiont of Stachyamoeba lipophora TaxID=2486578 RepID=UPI000F6483C6|nr:cold-shock protein [Rickettsiales endosymbiont of Stachyamoeba lipophora]AZL16295.1 cold-shock protein [Rickettsiales endosymbiont of Stachyamoeba lipophora]
MLQGKIKWFNYNKGYGFVQPDNGDKDVFVHISALEKAGINVNDGDLVSYELSTQKGRTSAVNLKKLD